MNDLLYILSVFSASLLNEQNRPDELTRMVSYCYLIAAKVS